MPELESKPPAISGNLGIDAELAARHKMGQPSGDISVLSEV